MNDDRPSMARTQLQRKVLRKNDSVPAKDILRQYVITGASKILEGVLLQDGLTYDFLDGTGNEVRIDDRRFIEDDFTTLVDLGLLRLDHNSAGKRLYIFTRPAAVLVQSMDQPLV